MPNKETSWLFAQGKFPCKNCSKRHENCHSTCKDYLDAKAKYESYKEEHKYDNAYFDTNWRNNRI